MAGAMIVLATADSAVICLQWRNNLIRGFGDYPGILRVTWQEAATAGLVGTSSAIIQSFLVYRIHVASKSSHWLWRVYCVLAEALALSAVGCNWLVAVQVSRAASIVDQPGGRPPS